MVPPRVVIVLNLYATRNLSAADGATSAAYFATRRFPYNFNKVASARFVRANEAMLIPIPLFLTLVAIHKLALVVGRLAAAISGRHGGWQAKTQSQLVSRQ